MGKQAILEKLDQAWTAFKDALPEVLKQLDEIHRRLIDLVRRTDEGQCRSDTRFRRQLRLDTYHHYPEHAAAIRQWRTHRSAG